MFFQLFDSFFYISLAITFGLILLMVFHFKNRIHTLEEKNQDLSELCQMMIKELQDVKQIQQTIQRLPHPVQIPMSQSNTDIRSSASTPPLLQHAGSPSHIHVIESPESMSSYQKITVIDNDLEDDEDLETDVIDCEDEDEDDDLEIEEEAYEEDEVDLGELGELEEMGEMEELEEMDIETDPYGNIQYVRRVSLDDLTEEDREMALQEMYANIQNLDADTYKQFNELLAEEFRQKGIEGVSGLEFIPDGDHTHVRIKRHQKLVEPRVEELEEEQNEQQNEQEEENRIEPIGPDGSVKSVQSVQSDVETSLEDTLKKVEMDTIDTEDIHVLKMPEEEDVSVITESEPRATNKKNPYSKMTVQMLRTAVISKGLMSDPSKVKKQKLVEMLTEHEAESTQDPTV